MALMEMKEERGINMEMCVCVCVSLGKNILSVLFTFEEGYSCVIISSVLFCSFSGQTSTRTGR